MFLLNLNNLFLCQIVSSPLDMMSGGTSCPSAKAMSCYPCDVFQWAKVFFSSVY